MKKVLWFFFIPALYTHSHFSLAASVFPTESTAAMTFWTVSGVGEVGVGTSAGPPVIFSHETPTQTLSPSALPLPYSPSFFPGVQILAGAC